MSLFNIKKLEEDLKNATDTVLAKTKETFVNFFEAYRDGKKEVGSVIMKYTIVDFLDTELIYTMQGVYIILTDYKMHENECTFNRDGLTAIYRGECVSVRKRVQSHIYNRQYNNSYESRKRLKQVAAEKFSEPFYGACMKINPNISGVNIDDPEYKNSKWQVIVIKMSGSTSPIRRQAELAFDQVFNKPLASRE